MLSEQTSSPKMASVAVTTRWIARLVAGLNIDGGFAAQWCPVVPPRVMGEGSPAFEPAGRSGRLHAFGHWPRAISPVRAMTVIRKSIKSLSLEENA